MTGLGLQVFQGQVLFSLTQTRNGEWPENEKANEWEGVCRVADPAKMMFLISFHETNQKHLNQTSISFYFFKQIRNDFQKKRKII